MNPFQVKVKLVASGMLLLALLACAIMWFEAGLHQPGRKLNFFGGSNRIPFLERKHPESTLTFAAIGFCAFLVSLWLPSYLLSAEERRMPFWWTHGIGLIIFGSLFALFLYQARYINGVPHDVIQPGAILGLCACGGLVGTGFTVMVMSARTAKSKD